MSEMSLSSCSGAIVAGQEAGPEMGKSRWGHPEHMEEVEGEILYLPTYRYARVSHRRDTVPGSLGMLAVASVLDTARLLAVIMFLTPCLGHLGALPRCMSKNRTHHGYLKIITIHYFVHTKSKFFLLPSACCYLLLLFIPRDIIV